MSPRQAKVLELLARPQAQLQPKGEGFGLWVGSDQRRRPRTVLTRQEVRALQAEGLVEPAGPGLRLSPAGAKAAQRARAVASGQEAFSAHLGPLVARAVMDRLGLIGEVQGLDPEGPIRRLSRLVEPDGRPLLSPAAVRAAARFHRAFVAGQRGGMTTADWTAPPRGNSPRGNGAEQALVAGMAGRQTVQAALKPLAPVARRVVVAVAGFGTSLAALGRVEGWSLRATRLNVRQALEALAQAA